MTVRFTTYTLANSVLVMKNGFHFYARLVKDDDIFIKRKRFDVQETAWVRLITHLKTNLQNLKDGKSIKLITVRSLYYVMANDIVLKDEIKDSMIRTYIDQLCCYLGCTRRSLGVYASDLSSSFTGNIIVTRKNMGSDVYKDVDLSMFYQPNTVYFSNIVSVKPSACPPKFILLVEKMTVFEELISYQFTHRLPYVIITGGGEPSMDCRLFVRLVSKSLEIPIFALVDANPYGLEIFKTYKYGSFNMAFMNHDLVAPSIRLLGLFGSDLKKCGIQETDMIAMKNRDLEKARTLVSQDRIHLEPKEVYETLEFNLNAEKKADLEILSVKKGIGCLGDYLEVKIMALLNVAS